MLFFFSRRDETKGDRLATDSGNILCTGHVPLPFFFPCQKSLPPALHTYKLRSRENACSDFRGNAKNTQCTEHNERRPPLKKAPDRPHAWIDHMLHGHTQKRRSRCGAKPFLFPITTSPALPLSQETLASKHFQVTSTPQNPSNPADHPGHPRHRPLHLSRLRYRPPRRRRLSS